MNNDTIELRIADLIAMLLKAFKPILFVTLLFGFLGAGFGVFRSINSGNRIAAQEEAVIDARENVADAQDKLEKAEEALFTREQADIPLAEDLVRNAEELVRSRQEYLDSSLLSSIDPLHCGVALLNVRVEAGSGSTQDAANALASSVSRLFPDNSELLSVIQGIMKTDAEYAYIKELISVSCVSETNAEITVYHSDPQIAEKAADAVFAELSRYLTKESLFTCEVLDRFCGFEANWDMRDRQLLSKENLVSAEQTLADAKSNLQGLKKNVPTLEKAVEDANSELDKASDALENAQRNYEYSLPTTKRIVKNSVRYLVIMLFVGLIFCCFAVISLRIVSGKLLNRSMILSCCEYPLLGSLPSENHRLFEKTIRRLENESEADYQSTAKAVSQTLFSLVGSQNVCYVSSLGKQELEALVSITDARIPACGNINSDPDAIKTLSSFDSIILVEKKDVSMISKIDDEIQRAKALGKKILGIVLT